MKLYKVLIFLILLIFCAGSVCATDADNTTTEDNYLSDGLNPDYEIPLKHYKHEKINDTVSVDSYKYVAPPTKPNNNFIKGFGGVIVPQNISNFNISSTLLKLFMNTPKKIVDNNTVQSTNVEEVPVCVGGYGITKNSYKYTVPSVHREDNYKFPSTFLEITNKLSNYYGTDKKRMPSVFTTEWDEWWGVEKKEMKKIRIPPDMYIPVCETSPFIFDHEWDEYYGVEKKEMKNMIPPSITEKIENFGKIVKEVMFDNDPEIEKKVMKCMKVSALAEVGMGTLIFSIFSQVGIAVF